MAVKHLIVLKFKDEITEAQKEEFFKTYVNLVNIIPAMKDVYWGKDVTQKNKEEGYTHIVEVTFESVETIQDYIIHPAHVGFGDVYRSFWEKLLIFDYTPRNCLIRSCISTMTSAPTYAPFKDEITEAQKEEFFKTYVNLVNIIPAMKDVYWGKDVTQKNKEEGYTHIVEVTFESVETIQDYIIHPAHVGFGDVYRSFWEKLLIFDYTPRK
ncbi:hypothetical protein G4B88_003863 [Cannabis sativa]|uniref:Stress-response A/B barrel domain-containing protein n=1 Tax=Cannabis sativa TaxID=3483 RepID=A0A7J6FL09_CANSA|nr:hypothetical protein G4B88_003863 [Cannabis sativa]